MKNLWMPAEWAPHQAVWMAFPYLEHEWGDAFEGAREEIADFIKAITHHGNEKVNLLVRNQEVENQARSLIGDQQNLQFHQAPYGDIWTRDTSAIVAYENKNRVALRFKFNCWGNKFTLPNDDTVGDVIANAMNIDMRLFDLVLEGGAIEVDGEGTLLTTESCLFEKNRNPHMTRSNYEEILKEAFGVQQIVWIAKGLLNDHTDGHIDTIARFIGPNRVVCMRAQTDEDPNREILKEIAEQLSMAKDAQGRSLEVIYIPSPGYITNQEGEILPATYCNFYISNKAVIVPMYGSPFDDEAINIFKSLFQDRKVIGLSSRRIICGGGSFHCMTQQEPR